MVFRAFDEGVVFRYALPEQPALQSFEIMRELTEFHTADDPRAWWIQSYDPTNRYELLYASGPASHMPTVHTPLTMKTLKGLYIVIHEADLVDYAGMNIVGDRGRRLGVDLPRWADGAAVKGQTPFQTPWRTIQLADRAADLVPATMTLNLNPPSVIDDVSWIEPMKYVGIWWGMHINVNTWASGAKHGATTENTRRYIDFAADNGFGGVLVEGWNVGWDGDWLANAERFSFTEPYPDYDLEGLAAYAREKGVTLIGHNETSMGVENYDRQLEDAFALYERLGIRAIKTGYVGDKTAAGHAHHGQYMVRHWRKVLEAAARHRIMVDVHEPIKDTGERRTWPNMMTREGARGMEYNAWGGDGGNPPEHETILFFTRLLAGPMDYTPGVLDILIASANGTPRPPEAARVRTTLAKQLALYVVLYSPAADGRRPDRELRGAAGLPVHPGRAGGLGTDPGPGGRDRRLRGGGPPGAGRSRTGTWAPSPTKRLAPSRSRCPSFRRPALRRRDLRRRTRCPLAATTPCRSPSPAGSGRGAVLTLRLAPGGGQAIRLRPIP